MTRPGGSHFDKTNGDTVTTENYFSIPHSASKHAVPKAGSCVRLHTDVSNKTLPPSSEYKLAYTYQITRCQDTEDHNTNLLTPCSGVLLHKLMAYQLDKKFSAVSSPRYTNSPPAPNRSHTSPARAPFGVLCNFTFSSTPRPSN